MLCTRSETVGGGEVERWEQRVCQGKYEKCLRSDTNANLALSRNTYNIGTET